MKIIHVLLGKSNPNTANGVNKFINSVATELALKNYDTEVWGISKNSNVNFECNYQLKIFKKKNIFSIDGQIIKKIKLLDNKNTVFHFHSVFIKEFYQITRILIKYNFKYVVSPHSGYSKAALKSKNLFLKYIYISIFESNIIKKASLLHVNNPSELDYFQELIENKLIVTTPNGFNLSNNVFRYNNNENYIIGFMGRFSIKHKGLDILLEGFNEYILQNGIGNLYLIGSGPIKNIVSTLNTSTQKKITIYEPQFGLKKTHILSKMSIFIHSSRWEGFPLSLLEAAANSLPLIVSKQTNLGKYVRQYKSGLVLENNTPEEVLKALFIGEKLFKEKTLQKKYSKNAFKMVENEFSWSNIVDKIINGYEEILGL